MRLSVFAAPAWAQCKGVPFDFCSFTGSFAIALPRRIQQQRLKRLSENRCFWIHPLTVKSGREAVNSIL